MLLRHHGMGLEVAGLPAVALRLGSIWLATEVGLASVTWPERRKAATAS
jgi:hypothetical protein